MSEKSEPNTSTPVQHPPREAGQVWKWGDGPPRTLTKCRVPPWGGELWSTTDGVDVAMCGDLTGWVFISPAKPAVDRAGCKAWCGLDGNSKEYQDADESVASGTAWFGGGKCTAEAIRYCSPACRDARVPPLEPVGDGWAGLCGITLPSGHRCRLNDGHANACSMWRAKPAKPAPVVQAPVCLGCRKSPCNHGYAMCEQGAGGWGRRETMGAVMLHETKLPERLTPARLAHSMGIEDDTLEDA